MSSNNISLNEDNKRIWFIQMLRAVAAISVLMGHTIFQYWTDRVEPELMIKFFRLPSNEHVPEWVISLYNWQVEWLKLGEYGVAVFFLISGYIIPISLKKHQ